MATLPDTDLIKGNIVNITNPTSTVSGKLGSLQGQLSDPSVSSLIPKGMSADSMISDSLRCRMEELGGKIMDLIEDGFGIGNILDSLKEPDLSFLGDALKALSPANILNGLKNISIEDIGSAIGKVIDGAVGFVTDIVSNTFDQVEKIMKGLGDTFDSFGDRIKDLGGLVESTINGIVSGIGDALSKIGDIPGAIGDAINSMLAPCAKLPNDPNVLSQVDLHKNKELFNENQNIVRGNVITIGEIASVTGKLSKNAQKAVIDSVATPGSTIVTGTTGQAVFGPTGVPVTVTVPIAANAENATGGDGVRESNKETMERRKAEKAAAIKTIKSTTEDITTTAVTAKKAEENVSEIKADDDGEATGDTAKNEIFAPLKGCEGMFNDLSDRVATIIAMVDDINNKNHSSSGNRLLRLNIDRVHFTNHIERLTIDTKTKKVYFLLINRVDEFLKNELPSTHIPGIKKLVKYILTEYLPAADAWKKCREDAKLWTPEDNYKWNAGRSPYMSTGGMYKLGAYFKSRCAKYDAGFQEYKYADDNYASAFPDICKS